MIKRPGFSLLMLLIVSVAPAFSQNSTTVTNINKWFDSQKGKKYDIQTPGQIQKSSTIQRAGEIQVPRGIQAIKTQNKSCESRLLVNADALFEFDKSTLTPRAEETLNVVGPMLQKLGPHPVTIEGHTDSVGGDEYNQTLSEKRAERVRNWLMENHLVPPDTAIAGYGKRRPVAPNQKPDGSDNPAGRQKNRRVEIVVDTCKSLSDSTAPASQAGQNN